LRPFYRNPIASYIALGVVLNFFRYSATNSLYSRKYSEFDKQRKEELEKYLAEQVRPDQASSAERKQD
jgi:hypothetical protein